MSFFTKVVHLPSPRVQMVEDAQLMGDDKLRLRSHHAVLF